MKDLEEKLSLDETIKIRVKQFIISEKDVKKGSVTFEEVLSIVGNELYYRYPHLVKKYTYLPKVATFIYRGLSILKGDNYFSDLFKEKNIRSLEDYIEQLNNSNWITNRGLINHYNKVVEVFKKNHI